MPRKKKDVSTSEVPEEEVSLEELKIAPLVEEVSEDPISVDELDDWLASAAEQITEPKAAPKRGTVMKTVAAYRVERVEAILTGTGQVLQGVVTVRDLKAAGTTSQSAINWLLKSGQLVPYGTVEIEVPAVEE